MTVARRALQARDRFNQQIRGTRFIFTALYAGVIAPLANCHEMKGHGLFHGHALSCGCETPRHSRWHAEHTSSGTGALSDGRRWWRNDERLTLPLPARDASGPVADSGSKGSVKYLPRGRVQGFAQYSVQRKSRALSHNTIVGASHRQSNVSAPAGGGGRVEAVGVGAAPRRMMAARLDRRAGRRQQTAPPAVSAAQVRRRRRQEAQLVQDRAALPRQLGVQVPTRNMFQTSGYGSGV